MLIGNPTDGGASTRLAAIAVKMYDLKQALKKLASREEEIRRLQAESDSLRAHLTQRTNQVDSEINQAIALALEESEQDKVIKDALRREKTELEANLKEKDQVIRAQESTLKVLEEKLLAAAKQLESKVEERAKLREI